MSDDSVLIRQLQGRIVALERAAGAFSIVASASTSVPTATFTPVALAVEELDVEGWVSTSRYTPQTVGYYDFNGAAGWADSLPDGTLVMVGIAKNGTVIKRVIANMGAAGNDAVIGVAAKNVFMNGSTDYVELHVRQSSGSTKNTVAGSDSRLEGRFAGVA